MYSPKRRALTIILALVMLLSIAMPAFSITALADENPLPPDLGEVLILPPEEEIEEEMDYDAYALPVATGSVVAGPNEVVFELYRGSGIVWHTVTGHTSGAIGWRNWPDNDITVVNGSNPGRPDATTRPGYVFGGWYRIVPGVAGQPNEAGVHVRTDHTNGVPGGTVLFGRWEPLSNFTNLHAHINPVTGVGSMPAPNDGMISVAGNRFVDAAGNEMVFKGIGMWGGTQTTLAPYERFTEADFAKFADIGFDHSRLYISIPQFQVAAPCTWTAATGCDCGPRTGLLTPAQLAAGETYNLCEGLIRSYLTPRIEWARRYGLTLMLNVHFTPGMQGISDRGFFDDVELSTGSHTAPQPANSPDGIAARTAGAARAKQLGLADFWQTVARIWHDETVIAGFDLINEPMIQWRQNVFPGSFPNVFDPNHANAGWNYHPNFRPDYSAEMADYSRILQEVTDAIRVYSDHVVVVERLWLFDGSDRNYMVGTSDRGWLRSFTAPNNNNLEFRLHSGDFFMPTITDDNWALTYHTYEPSNYCHSGSNMNISPSGTAWHISGGWNMQAVFGEPGPNVNWINRGYETMTDFWRSWMPAVLHNVGGNALNVYPSGDVAKFDNNRPQVSRGGAGHGIAPDTVATAPGVTREVRAWFAMPANANISRLDILGVTPENVWLHGVTINEFPPGTPVANFTPANRTGQPVNITIANQSNANDIFDAGTTHIIWDGDVGAGRLRGGPGVMRGNNSDFIGQPNFVYEIILTVSGAAGIGAGTYLLYNDGAFGMNRSFMEFAYLGDPVSGHLAYIRDVIGVPAYLGETGAGSETMLYIGLETFPGHPQAEGTRGGWFWTEDHYNMLSNHRLGSSWHVFSEWEAQPRMVAELEAAFRNAFRPENWNPTLATNYLSVRFRDGAQGLRNIGVQGGGTLGNRMPADPVRDGYSFVGWTTVEGGTTPNFTGATVVNANTIVYAIWDVHNYVVFDLNFPGAPANIEVAFTAGEPLGAAMPAVPARAGYGFAGWFATPTGAAGDEQFNRNTVVTGGRIVFARWVAIPEASNLLPPPFSGFETPMAGPPWPGGQYNNPSRTQDYARTGDWSLRLVPSGTPGADGWASLHTVGGLTVGEVHEFSAWVRTATGAPNVTGNIGIHNPGETLAPGSQASQSYTATNEWTRVSFTFIPAVSTFGQINFGLPSGGHVFLDDVFLGPLMEFAAIFYEYPGAVPIAVTGIAAGTSLGAQLPALPQGATGWFTSQGGQGREVTADCLFFGNITAFAYPADGTGANYHTVTFDLDGGSIGADLGPIIVANVPDGTALGTRMPANPTRDNHRFGGWSDGFTAATLVNANMTVTALWLSADVSIADTCPRNLMHAQSNRGFEGGNGFGSGHFGFGQWGPEFTAPNGPETTIVNSGLRSLRLETASGSYEGFTAAAGLVPGLKYILSAYVYTTGDARVGFNPGTRDGNQDWQNIQGSYLLDGTPAPVLATTAANRGFVQSVGQWTQFNSGVFTHSGPANHMNVQLNWNAPGDSAAFLDDFVLLRVFDIVAGGTTIEVVDGGVLTGLPAGTWTLNGMPVTNGMTVGSLPTDDITIARNVAGVTLTGDAAEPAGLIRTEGYNFVDADGNVVVFRGIGLWGGTQNCTAPYERFTRDDFERFADIGFDHARLYIALPQFQVDRECNWDGTSCDCVLRQRVLNAAELADPNDRYFFCEQLIRAYIDPRVEWAREFGMTLMLNVHFFPGREGISDRGFWHETVTWTNPDDASIYHVFNVGQSEDARLPGASAAKRQGLLDFWVQIAEMYIDEYVIAGFDLINEPIMTALTAPGSENHAGTGFVGGTNNVVPNMPSNQALRDAFTAEPYLTIYTDYINSVIAAIRATGNEHVIVVENLWLWNPRITPGWANPSTPNDNTMVFARYMSAEYFMPRIVDPLNNWALTWHSYEPANFAHSAPALNIYPGGLFQNAPWWLSADRPSPFPQTWNDVQGEDGLYWTTMAQAFTGLLTAERLGALTGHANNVWPSSTIAKWGSGAATTVGALPVGDYITIESMQTGTSNWHDVVHEFYMPANANVLRFNLANTAPNNTWIGRILTEQVDAAGNVISVVRDQRFVSQGTVNAIWDGGVNNAVFEEKTDGAGVTMGAARIVSANANLNGNNGDLVLGPGLRYRVTVTMMGENVPAEAEVTPRAFLLNHPTRRAYNFAFLEEVYTMPLDFIRGTGAYAMDGPTPGRGVPAYLGETGIKATCFINNAFGVNRGGLQWVLDHYYILETHGISSSWHAFYEYEIQPEIIPCKEYSWRQAFGTWNPDIAVTFMNGAAQHAVVDLMSDDRHGGVFIGQMRWPDVPVSGDLEFVGWFTQPNGAGTRFANTTRVTGNMTVFAHFEGAQVTVFTTTVDTENQQLVRGIGGGIPWRNPGHNNNQANLGWVAPGVLESYQVQAGAQAILDMGTSIMRVYWHNQLNLWYTDGTPTAHGESIIANYILGNIRWLTDNNIPYILDGGINAMVLEAYIPIYPAGAGHGAGHADGTHGMLNPIYEDAFIKAHVDLLIRIRDAGLDLPTSFTLYNEAHNPVQRSRGIPRDQAVRLALAMREAMDAAGFYEIRYGWEQAGQPIYANWFNGDDISHLVWYNPDPHSFYMNDFYARDFPANYIRPAGIDRWPYFDPIFWDTTGARGPETGWPFFNPDSDRYIEALDVATGNFWIHSYWGGRERNQQYIDGHRAQGRGRDILQTEWCPWENPRGTAYGWPHIGQFGLPCDNFSLVSTRHFISDMSFFGFNYWLYWNLWNTNMTRFGGDAMMSNVPGTSIVRIPGFYYVLQNINLNIIPNETYVRRLTTNVPGMVTQPDDIPTGRMGFNPETQQYEWGFNWVTENTFDKGTYMDGMAFVSRDSMVILLVNPDPDETFTTSLGGLFGTTTTTAWQMIAEDGPGTSANHAAGIRWSAAPNAADQITMGDLGTFAIVDGVIESIVLPPHSITVIVTNAGDEDMELEYRLNLSGGRANTYLAKEGETINIRAFVPEGRQFVRWVSDDVTIVDYTNPITSFVMIGQDNVFVRAEFRDLPTLTLTPATVTVDDANLSVTVVASGTAEGAMTFNRGALPEAITLTQDGNNIVVAGERPAAGQPAITGMYTVTATRDGVEATLTVNLNLTPLPTAVELTYTLFAEDWRPSINIRFFLNGTPVAIPLANMELVVDGVVIDNIRDYTLNIAGWQTETNAVFICKVRHNWQHLTFTVTYQGQTLFFEFTNNMFVPPPVLTYTLFAEDWRTSINIRFFLDGVLAEIPLTDMELVVDGVLIENIRDFTLNIAGWQTATNAVFICKVRHNWEHLTLTVTAHGQTLFFEFINNMFIPPPPPPVLTTTIFAEDWRTTINIRFFLDGVLAALPLANIEFIADGVPVANIRDFTINVAGWQTETSAVFINKLGTPWRNMTVNITAYGQTLTYHFVNNMYPG